MNLQLLPVSARWARLQIRASRACLALFVLLLSACNFQQFSPQDLAQQTEVRATELELHVQQTLVAQQATAQGPEMTRQAELATQRALTAAATPVPNLEPTGGGMDASQQATASAVPPTLPAAEPTAEPTAGASSTPAGLDEAALKERMKTANILVYEDMVSRSATNRYVKDTLVRMGLPFKDDGNATGWLIEDLKNGASDGKVWDLVILALEDKVSVQSGFLNYALQALDSGSSVILETWFLDSTYQGGGRAFLDRCGVEYQGNRIKIAPGNLQLFAMVRDHPLLNQPNSGISLSKTSNYWWDSTGRVAYDTGDLLKLASGSTAQLIVGAQTGNTNDHATLAVCDGGRMILQTFSSHTLDYDTMTLLWENYIYNALKTHFEAGQ